MAKWFGKIGYNEPKTLKPGVIVDDVIEKEYYGELVSNRRSLNQSDQVNDDITINNQFSIVSDPYAVENFHKILYVTYMGTKWKVNTVEVQYPRLILTVGGVYNG